MICPMKSYALANPKFDEMFTFETLNLIVQCNKEQCAWYCQYPNGEGECAIHSLPGLFDGLQDIAKEIGIK